MNCHQTAFQAIAIPLWGYLQLLGQRQASTTLLVDPSTLLAAKIQRE